MAKQSNKVKKQNEIQNFQGVMTALVTPFKKSGQVDYDSLKKHVESQIIGGVDVLIPLGTTGESPTLSHEEKIKIVKTVIKQAKGRVLVVAGAGSNSTALAVKASKEMQALGVDGILSVCPYYNKPTQKGFYFHFREIARAVKIPIILYNVPGRTGKKMENDVVIKLANEFPNIVAMKEATGDMNNMKDLIKRAPKGFNVISGDDGLTLELIRNGGKGIISVASNIVPAEMKKMVNLAMSGRFEEAEKIDRKLQPLFSIIFIETNPIPVKTALAMQGRIHEFFRLPMCEMEPENREKLKRALKEQGLI